MKADCEILIAHDLLMAALSASSGLFDPSLARLYPDPRGLGMRSGAVTATIPAEGEWSRGVEVRAAALVAILERTATKSVALIYAAGRLTINRVTIEAREYLLPLGSYRSPTRGEQLAFPGLPRDLHHVAGRKLTPRVRQLASGGLPLFDPVAR